MCGGVLYCAICRYHKGGKHNQGHHGSQGHKKKKGHHSYQGYKKGHRGHHNRDQHKSHYGSSGGASKGGKVGYIHSTIYHTFVRSDSIIELSFFCMYNAARGTALRRKAAR